MVVRKEQTHLLEQLGKDSALLFAKVLVSSTFGSHQMTWPVQS